MRHGLIGDWEASYTSAQRGRAPNSRFHVRVTSYSLEAPRRYVNRMAPFRLTILVFPETHRTWTARALEHDLSAEGKTIESAVDTLVKIACAQIAYDRRHSRIPLSAFAAAPQLYWRAFDRATRLPTPVEFNWTETGAPPRIVAAVLSKHPAVRQFPTAIKTA